MELEEDAPQPHGAKLTQSGGNSARVLVAHPTITIRPLVTPPVHTGAVATSHQFVDGLWLLEQAEVWVTEDGDVLALSALSMLERARLLRQLRRRARVAWLSSLLRRELGDRHFAPHHEAETPEAWLEARPLVRRLVELNRGPVSLTGTDVAAMIS